MTVLGVGVAFVFGIACQPVPFLFLVAFHLIVSPSPGYGNNVENQEGERGIESTRIYVVERLLSAVLPRY
jgi:hypothetical protein